MNSRVSIIVPIFNSENYLDACIDSVNSQNYPNWELILVDDGSTDNSSGIAKRWAKSDNRIKYYRTENRGVSSARNFGIERAESEFIMFLDSDDILNNTILDYMLSDIDNDIDFVACNIRNFSGIPDTDSSNNYIDIIKYFSLSVLYADLAKNQLLNPPFAKLFRRNIIEEHGIRFNSSLSLGEDFCFNLDYLDVINSGALIDCSLYYYRNTPASLSKKIQGDYADIQMMLFDKEYKFIKRHHINTDLKEKSTRIVKDIFLTTCRNKIDKKQKIKSINKLKKHKLMQISYRPSTASDAILHSIIKYLPSSLLVNIFK